MSETKTHYRKVFKSDHLGVADLEEMIEEGKSLKFTIAQVKQEYDVKVAGKKGDFNIAYFKESIKPLVLNSYNSKVVKSFANNDPYVESWKNIEIELYVDNSVKFGKEVVGGVRIKYKAAVTLPELQKMYKDKSGSVPESEVKQVEGVINGKKQAMYQRVYDYLSKLK